MIDRDIIINKLKESLELLEYVHAMWLEGADSAGLVDEYSDIDFWVDFDDEKESEVYEAVESALAEVSEIDLKEVIAHGHPKIRQRIYHLKDTSPYLMIDFCWQLHSRDKNETVLIEGNKIEGAKVLFDKSQIVRFVPYDKSKYIAEHDARYRECIYRYTQHSRVLKYVGRGLYLEAYAYYNRYVLEPLIDMLRLIYTPANTDYYLVHISHHIPALEREKLEYYAKIPSLEEIKIKTEQAEVWFDELKKRYDNL